MQSAGALGLKPDIAIPKAQVQHWVGAAFLPGETLEAVLPRLRNYNNRGRYMMPDVVASRLKDRQGDVYSVYMRLAEKSILSGVFDLDLRIVYRTPAPGRLLIESRSQSVVEVADSSAPPDSPGKDHGLLWALNHYWRILQGDGGLLRRMRGAGFVPPDAGVAGLDRSSTDRRGRARQPPQTIRATVRMMNSPDAAN